MEIILISPENNSENEHELINFFFENGLKYFHLRKPEYSVFEMKKYIHKVPEIYRKRIILHSHYELISEFSLKGGHFSIKRMNEFEKFKKFDFQKSYSAHNFLELEKYHRELDYIFISPVFDSISKTGYKSNFDLTDIQDFIGKKNAKNIVALGGISIENISKLENIPFFGLAFLGYIWNTDFETSKKRYIDISEHLRLKT